VIAVTTPSSIRRLLVANRGEIAARVIRTARRMGIQTVAICSDADADAPYVRLADRVVRLPGVTSAETYLDGAAVITAAQAAGADAIHPGYGFLSENPRFARDVIRHELTWVGPSPEAIESMALKVEAKRIAAAAGVPLAPGCDLPESMIDGQLLFACASVGYPLIVKASAGGGGKGMRVVERADDLVDAVAAARREATSAFGDGTVFAERYLPGGRHVEVQVVGDSHGGVIHLFERECSIQRRHQKIIEEAPSPGVSPRVRNRLHDAAVALARQIDYVGAGTVEFMVAGEGDEQEAFFLEMNTRLQVEHPVTEAITGLDLVELQLLVAQGERLPVKQADIAVAGHAIEARLYAEDPAHGYLPATGVVHRFRPGPGIRVDAGVVDGSVVTSHYDPMLAKVIAHGETRSVAAGTLADGLARLELHAPPTNRDSLVATLRSDALLAGDTTTAFLEQNPQVLDPQPAAEDIERHGRAAARAVLEGERPEALLPLAWRNVPGPLPTVGLRRRGESTAREMAVGPDSTVVEVDEGSGDVVVDVTVDGVTAHCRVARYGDELFVDDGLASTVWELEPRFPDHSAEAGGHGAVTPVPGTVTAVHVRDGDVVETGQVLVVLEAMKMEHRIAAEAEGTVARVLVEVGQSVDAHALVVEFADVDDADGSGVGE
jgi:propionyl-CoA carboxylase alpha chain